MKRILLIIFFVSAAFVSFAADTVSYRLTRLENWAFYGTASPTVELVAVNSRGVDENLDLRCSIFNYQGRPLYELSQSGIVPQRDSLKMSFAFKTLEPGFYNAVFESEGRIVREVNMSYEPEKIVWDEAGSDELPAFSRDFVKLANTVSLERRDFDPKFSIVRNKTMSGKEKNVYDFKMVSLDGKVVKGYVAFPRGKKELKSMLTLVPMENRNENPLADFSAGADMVELVLYLVERGTGVEYFKNLLADMQLGIDFLSKREETIPDAVYVQGEGTAGACSLVASVMDDRVAVSFVSVPDFSSFIENFAVASIAGKVKAPVLFGLGLQDNTGRLHEDFAIYNALGGVKEYFIFPDSSTIERSKWKYIRDTFILRIQ